MNNNKVRAQGAKGINRLAQENVEKLKMRKNDYNVKTPAEVEAERNAKTENNKREKAQQKLDAELRQKLRGRENQAGETRGGDAG